jgi:hypothetical protein
VYSGATTVSADSEHKYCENNGHMITRFPKKTQLFRKFGNLVAHDSHADSSEEWHQVKSESGWGRKWQHVQVGCGG